MSTLTFLAIIPMLIAAQSCNDPQTVCGCLRRQTFDGAWLESQHPDVFAQYKNSVIQSPVVTYGENNACDEIVVTCPTGFRIGSFNLSTNAIKFDSRNYPNPSPLSDLTCFEGEWMIAGLMESIDDNLKSDSLGCFNP